MVAEAIEPKEENVLLDTSFERVVDVAIERLDAFENQPFQVRDDEEMEVLFDSIKRYGILNPLIISPKDNGQYLIVSGHRRKYCAEQLGLTKVPAIIRIMKKEEAIITMVDSNLHREKILFSERAYAYKMKNDAMKRLAGRHKNSMEGEANKVLKRRIVNILADEAGESPRQVGRYIRITKLIPELMELLDKGKISFNPAVEISFLTEEEQRWLFDAIEYTQAYPSLSQAQRLKYLSRCEDLTEEQILQIMSEVKKDEVSRVSFKNTLLYRYFPRDYTIDQIKEEILKLLDKTYGDREEE